MNNKLSSCCLLAILSLASLAAARDRGCCCDPMAAQLQSRCCQGSLLPYHVALQRADDATTAEASLAHVTSERNYLQAELDKAQADLKAAIAERDQAREEAANAAKLAKDHQAQAAAAKQAADIAARGKADAEAVAAKPKS